MGRNAKLRQARRGAWSPRMTAHDHASINALRVDMYMQMGAKAAEAFRQTVATDALTRMPPLIGSIAALPESFRSAFARLWGHLLCPGRMTDDIAAIISSLRAVTEGEENERALASWPFAPDLPVVDSRVDPRHACYSLLQKTMETSPSPCAVEAIRRDASVYGKHSLLGAIEAHLVCSSIVAAGLVLCQSGSLLIGHQPIRECHDNENEHLWLFRRRPDGIYAVSSFSGHPPLCVSEVKKMRQWVQSYRGRPLTGKFNFLSAVDSLRICRAIGLTVRGEYATLEPIA